MDQTDQITRQTGLVPDVQAVEGSAVPKWFFRSLLGRTGQPHDVVSAMLFWASDDAGWITGAILPLLMEG